MTGDHIRKNQNGDWEYPHHEGLEKKCQLFPIDTYIKWRRGTLWQYLESNRKDLIKEVKKLTAPSKNNNKILWWKQPHISKTYF